MRLSYLADDAPIEDARALVWHGVGAARAEIDLDRTYTVGPVQELRPWPLDLLLGLDGSTTRILDLAVWAPGYDWARTTLGMPRIRTGTHVAGHEAVATIRKAIEARQDDLRALVRVAHRLFSVDNDLTNPRATRASAELAKLVAGVVVVPSELVGPHGQLVMAYESDDLIALAAVEMMRRSEEQGPALRECGHCGCLFAPVERTDEEYCRRSAPGEPTGGRTCRQVGPQRRYAATVDDLTAAYRREYKRLDKRQRRGGFSRDDLDTWRTAARAMLDRAKRRGATTETFMRQLAEIEPEVRQP